MKPLTKLATTLPLLAAPLHAETLFSNYAGLTNHIDLAEGEVALVQYVSGSSLRWNSPDGKTTSLEAAYSATVANPAILAGPGSLSAGSTILTYQRLKMTNAATVVVSNTPVTIAIGAYQRVTLQGYPVRTGKERPVIQLSVAQSGGEFTPGPHYGAPTLTQTPVVIDGPHNVFVWTSAGEATVTCILQEPTVKAPDAALSNHNERAIEVQTSEDGVNWTTSSVILPGAGDKKFFRLK